MESRHLTLEQLSASLDGELSPTEQRLVEAHLADCAACQRELAELQQTVALLRALPATAPPRSFRVPESVRPAVAGPRRWAQPTWLRALGGAAAALMVMVLAVDAVLPTMQVSTSAATAPSSSAPTTELAPAVGAVPERPTIPASSEALQRAGDNAAARAVAPLAGTQPITGQSANEDQAAKLAPTVPESFAGDRETAEPRPQRVLSRPTQAAAVALGLLAALLFGASVLVRRV